MLYLYLDDERCPKTDLPWQVVRTPEAFMQAVETQGFPVMVSFDHDLGLEYETGLWCAKWLVNYGLDREINPYHTKWNVHSANVCGAANIRSVLASWCKVWDMDHPQP
jgi:hypothetical protein